MNILWNQNKQLFREDKKSPKFSDELRTSFLIGWKYGNSKPVIVLNLFFIKYYISSFETLDSELVTSLNKRSAVTFTHMSAEPFMQNTDYECRHIIIVNYHGRASPWRPAVQQPATIGF